jgi:hypothetical protein
VLKFGLLDDILALLMLVFALGNRRDMPEFERKKKEVTETAISICKPGSRDGKQTLI